MKIRIFAIAALMILAAGVFFAGYLANAEAEFRRGTPESVARAVELRPSNTRYLSLRALQLDYDGADVVPVLERIALLNPVSSAPRIRLGLAAELRGDFLVAEHWLLSAARVDRQFEPSWTLANFYFRRESPEEFWPWIRRALEVSYGDRTPGFELCWRIAKEHRQVLDQAIPDRPEVAASYLYYLLERHKDDIDALEEAALRLTGRVRNLDTNASYAICELLIERGRATSARKLWVALGNAEPNGVVNGEFRDAQSQSRGRGFDWRVDGGEGVVHLPLDGGGHRVTLSGKQSESSRLLRQVVLLEQGKRYMLRWKSRTTGFASPTGLRWNVGSASGLVESSEDWQEGSVVFDALSALTSVSLTYQRPVGVPRAEGSLDVKSVSIATQSVSAAATGKTTSSPK